MIVDIYTYTIDVRRTSADTGLPYGTRKPMTRRAFGPVPDRTDDDPDARLYTEIRCEPEPTRVAAPGAELLDGPGPQLLRTARGDELTAEVAYCAARVGAKGLRIVLGPARPSTPPPARERVASAAPAEPTAPTTQAGFGWAGDEPGAKRRGRPRRADRADQADKMLSPAGAGGIDAQA